MKDINSRTFHQKEMEGNHPKKKKSNLHKKKEKGDLKEKTSKGKRTKKTSKRKRIIKKLRAEEMDPFLKEKAISEILDHFITTCIFDICADTHRALKMGYFCPMEYIFNVSKSREEGIVSLSEEGSETSENAADVYLYLKDSKKLMAKNVKFEWSLFPDLKKRPVIQSRITGFAGMLAKQFGDEDKSRGARKEDKKTKRQIVIEMIKLMKEKEKKEMENKKKEMEKANLGKEPNKLSKQVKQDKGKQAGAKGRSKTTNKPGPKESKKPAQQNKGSTTQKRKRKSDVIQPTEPPAKKRKTVEPTLPSIPLTKRQENIRGGTQPPGIPVITLRKGDYASWTIDKNTAQSKKGTTYETAKPISWNQDFDWTLNDQGCHAPEKSGNVKINESCPKKSGKKNTSVQQKNKAKPKQTKGKNKAKPKQTKGREKASQKKNCQQSSNSGKKTARQKKNCQQSSNSDSEDYNVIINMSPRRKASDEDDEDYDPSWDK